MQCTGECCRNFTLVVDGAPITHASWLEGGFAEGDVARLAIPAAEESRFNCTMHDTETGLCRIYETRPQACRSFPFQTIQNGELTNTCQHCGYTQETSEGESCSIERGPCANQGGALELVQR